MDNEVDTTSQTITAQKGHVQALAFARKGGAALSALLGSIASAKETERRGPIQTMLFLETHFTDEETSAIPVVGSKKEDSGNKPYDRYTSELKTEQGTRKVPGSWFTDVVKSTDEWARINARIELLQQGQGEGVPADILSMGTGARKEEIAQLRQRIQDMRTALTRGAMLFHQCEEIRNLNPARIAIKLPIFTEKGSDGKEVQVVKGTMVRLMDPAKIVEDEVVTVGSFLQYDAAAAAKDPDGGTLASLKATASKAPKKKAVATGKEYTVPGNVDQVLTLFNVLASGIDQEVDAGEKLYAALLTKAAGDGADAREARISIGKVCLACDSLWTIIRPAYLRDVEAKAKAAVAKAAA